MGKNDNFGIFLKGIFLQFKWKFSRGPSSHHQKTSTQIIWKAMLTHRIWRILGKLSSDSPENCHLSVIKLPKTWYFFKKISKNCYFFMIEIFALHNYRWMGNKIKKTQFISLLISKMEEKIIKTASLTSLMKSLGVNKSVAMTTYLQQKPESRHKRPTEGQTRRSWWYSQQVYLSLGLATCKQT